MKNQFYQEYKLIAKKKNKIYDDNCQNILLKLSLDLAICNNKLLFEAN